MDRKEKARWGCGKGGGATSDGGTKIGEGGNMQKPFWENKRARLKIRWASPDCVWWFFDEFCLFAFAVLATYLGQWKAAL